MKRIQDHFYKRTIEQARDVKAFDPRAKYLAQRATGYTAEDNSEPVEQVLEKLGYNPKILHQISRKKMRVLRRDYGGFMARLASSNNPKETSRMFGNVNFACAFAGEVPDSIEAILNKGPDIMMLPDMEDTNITNFLSFLTGMNETDLEHVQSDFSVMMGLVLGHEATHFELGRPAEKHPQKYASIEAACDRKTLQVFGRNHDNTMDPTAEEFMHARAIHPFTTALKNKTTKDVKSYLHATALAIRFNALAHNPDNGKISIEAYKEAVERVHAHMRWQDYEPRKVQIYRAACKALNQNEFTNPWAGQAILLYIQAMDYFAPSVKKSVTGEPQTAFDTQAY
ncbi:MAG: hypothetical protein ACLFR0_07815 [Alphaproteobacteria bacterium]